MNGERNLGLERERSQRGEYPAPSEMDGQKEDLLELDVEPIICNFRRGQR